MIKGLIKATRTLSFFSSSKRSLYSCTLSSQSRFKVNFYHKNNQILKFSSFTKRNPEVINFGSMPETAKDDRIIWIDLEMTGLNIDTDLIMEIGCIITDGQLKEISRLEAIPIKIPDDVLSSMEEWCLNHHGQSGLIEDCKNSTINTKEAEERVLEFVKKFTNERKCPIAGNSVYMDRIFLRKYMPTFNAHCHYRIIDVSSIKELSKRWYPKVHLDAPAKKFVHRTMADLEDSIEELKFYRSKFFRSQESLLNEKD